MAEPLLKLTGINKSFAGVNALKDISIDIYPGTIYCLVGENGCGKSTLIKIISGVYSADSGTIELDGHEIKHMTPKEAMDNGIEVIYQDFSIFPNLTVAENIAFNSEISEKRQIVDWKHVRKQAAEALEKIGVEIPLDETVDRLSVANRQLIAISRAIAHNARILIMDEPTTALTKKEVDSLFGIVRGLNKSGISIVFVSHKLDEIMQLSQEVIVMRNGEKVAFGSIDKFSKESIIFHMTGRNIDFEPHNKPVSNNTEVVLSVNNISQKGGFNNVSFDLHKGEIIGLTGLLGSGRTALANALFGIHKIDSGVISIENKPVIIKNVRNAVKHGIAYVPEDRLTEGLFLEQSIKDNIAVTVLEKIKKGVGLNHKLSKEISKEWIETLRIKCVSESQQAKALSGGNQQKIVISKWLAQSPKVLILNGPTVGVDIGAKTDIITLISELADNGMSIILASDDVSEIMMCCNRILIMEQGSIIKQVYTNEITESELNEMIRGKEN